MNLLDDETPIDHDRLINDLYSLQVSLKMLAEELTRNRQPDISRETLQTLSSLHWFMARQHPSLMRH